MSTDDAELASLVAPLREAPDATVLAFDFDGTLAAVVDDPAAAVPIPGVPALLDELAGRYRRVVAISGRPVGFLARHLPGTVALSGLYGLESLVDGVVADHPDAAAWRPIVHDAASEAEEASAPGAALEGMLVEPKGLSLTLHVRTRPELEPAAVELARSLAERLGLEARPAKRSVELHPPIEVDKGTALREQIEAVEASAALFAGDDLGDLRAVEALGHLADVGTLRAAVAVAVGGPELPTALADRAALVLPGPDAVPALLRALLA
ncbi:MAG: trehalose-phosphatase [Acidimicrobiales bacterium]|nr:trehalose-phosphatase [Acidimicrobiales bacterium]